MTKEELANNDNIQIDAKKYLDDMIIFWRKERDGNSENKEIAPYYIDAFQSARNSMFGELLP